MIEFMFLIPAVITGTVLIPLMLLVYIYKRRSSAVIFSSLSLFRGIKMSLKYRLRHIPFILFLASIILFLTAFARPRVGDQLSVDYTEGIAIQMVIDRSSSMREALIINQQQMNYLEAAKNVAKDFILGNRGGLSGRPNDIVGFSSFALYVQENCPLTLDHKNLVRIIDSVKTAIPNSPEDGTAIGDAIFHSVLSLVSADEYIRSKGESEDAPKSTQSNEYTVKSKIVILLTDGLNRYGMEISEASEYAKKNDIKVYPILFAGKKLQEAYQLGDRRVISHINNLKKSAETTNGKFFMAFDNRSLHQVYREIDKLEKSKIKESYFRYFELFPYFIIAGLILLLLQIILSQTIFRKIP